MSELAREMEPLTDLVRFASFEDLLSGELGVVVPHVELIDLFFEMGRNLILAPAGAGKSTLLARLGEGATGVQKSV